MCGKCGDVTAVDIAQQPLRNARATAERYGLTERLRIRQSDGLSGVDADTEQIIIAGMGGTLIVRILTAAPVFFRDGVRLILQPMTRAEEVRRFLAENGFRAVREVCCEDADRVYTVIAAEYDGVRRDIDIFTCYFGELSDEKPELSRRYVRKQAEIVSAVAGGLRATGQPEAAAPYLAALEILKTEPRYGGIDI